MSPSSRFLLPLISSCCFFAGCSAEPAVGGDGSIIFSPDSSTPAADGGVADAMVGRDGAVEPPAATGDVVYPPGVVQSPINAEVAARWREVVGASTTSSNNVFAKVGDSISASEAFFLGCFSSQTRELGDHAELAETIDHFSDGDAAGSDPFVRDSLTAVGGWTAAKAVDGNPSPVQREIAAINPRFAVVMYGTNDSGFSDAYLFTYAQHMWTLLDTLMAKGILPILSTIPPRTDSSVPGGRVPWYNAIVRGFAQSRGLPLVDYHASMLPLPSQGLAGDGVHPTAFSSGSTVPCNLSAEALQRGYNMRNLVTLQALDRVHRALDQDHVFAEPTRRSLDGGLGTSAAPFEISELPFAHAATTVGKQSQLDTYSGCGADQDESGPEVVYRLDVDREMDLSIFLADPGRVDVDIHLLRGSPITPACEARDHQRIDYTVDPGTWYIVADSYVVGGSDVRSGDYMLVVADSL